MENATSLRGIQVKTLQNQEVIGLHASSTKSRDYIKNDAKSFGKMTHTNHFFWHCLLTSCPFLCGQILHDSTPDCKRPSADNPSLLLQNAAQNVGSAEFVVSAWWKLISHPGINYLVQQSSAYPKSTGLSQEEQAGLVLPKCCPKAPVSCRAAGWLVLL